MQTLHHVQVCVCEAIVKTKPHNEIPLRKACVSLFYIFPKNRYIIIWSNTRNFNECLWYLFLFSVSLLYAFVISFIHKSFHGIRAIASIMAIEINFAQNNEDLEPPKLNSTLHSSSMLQNLLDNPSMVIFNISLPTYLINSNFVVKLDGTNYLIWKKQLKYKIAIYDLQSIIDYSITIPSRLIKKHITTNTSNIYEMLEINPNYEL